MTRKITRLDLASGEPVDEPGTGTVPLIRTKNPPAPTAETVEDDLPPKGTGRWMDALRSVRADDLVQDGAGVWIAYHWDWSAMVLFRDEISALRHAVGNGMQVGYAPYGTELHEWVTR